MDLLTIAARAVHRHDSTSFSIRRLVTQRCETFRPLSVRVWHTSMQGVGHSEPPDPKFRLKSLELEGFWARKSKACRSIMQDNAQERTVNLETVLVIDQA